MNRLFAALITVVGLVISLVLGYKVMHIVLPEYITMWAIGQTVTVIGILASTFSND